MVQQKQSDLKTLVLVLFTIIFSQLEVLHNMFHIFSCILFSAPQAYEAVVPADSDPSTGQLSQAKLPRGKVLQLTKTKTKTE